MYIWGGLEGVAWFVGCNFWWKFFVGKRVSALFFVCNLGGGIIVEVNDVGYSGALNPCQAVAILVYGIRLGRRC